MMQENEHLPKYRVVFSDLYKKITGGYYKVNDILPSESELQENYGVSRITIRRAMDELQNIRLIKKYPGIGTIVINNKKLMNLKRLDSFSRENVGETSELISFDIISAPLNAQMNLKLLATEQVYRICRVRFVDDSPISLHEAYVPIKLLDLKEADFTDRHSSLYKIFNDQGIFLTNGRETIEVMPSSDELTEILKISKDIPLLYKERVSYWEDTPVEFVKMYYRGDKYKYQIDLKN